MPDPKKKTLGGNQGSPAEQSSAISAKNFSTGGLAVGAPSIGAVRAGHAGGSHAFGACPTDWTHLGAVLGLTDDLLPVISNPAAEISAASKMKELGKTPSRYNRDGHATGFPGWSQHISTDSEIRRWAQEPDYGICIQTRQTRAIDIDVPEHGRAAAIRQFVAEWLGVTLPIRSRSNSGKCLLAFTLPGEYSKRVIKVDGGIIEFLASGQQFIAVGTHTSGVRYEWEGGLPVQFPLLEAGQFEGLWSALSARFAIAPVAPLREPGGEVEVPSAPVEMAVLKSALDAIPNSGAAELDYDAWLSIVMALHYESAASSEGLALAHAFSSKAAKYNPDEVELEWGRIKGASHSGKVVTGRSVLHMARQYGWSDPTVVDDFDDLSGVIESDEEQLEQAAIRQRNKIPTFSEIAAYIEAHSLVETPQALGDAVTTMVARAKRKLSAIEEGQLVSALKDSTGGELKVADIRKDIAAKSKARAAAVRAPAWLKGWVFVTDMDRFFNIETARVYSRFAFDMAHAREIPEDGNGNRRKAHLVAAEDFGIELVDNVTYIPMCGPVFEMLGKTWANYYRPDLVPGVPDTLTSADRAAIEKVKGHLRQFLPDARERRLFASWLAHNVQKPGAKIRWSPYVCGVEGDGKTFFSQLLSTVLGAANVRPVNASTIEASEFNEWATGAAVIGIEEVKLQGHNRYDVANRLKPLITNDIVQIHPKGRPAYSAPNVTNYLLFSNYPDGMPVTDTDRRYFFLKGALDKDHATALTQAGYFKALFNTLPGHPGALREWLLEMELDPEFDADGRAPDTTMKRSVIQMCKNDVDETFDGLVDWADEDRPRVAGIGPKVISSAHLTRHLKNELSAAADGLATTRINRLISNAGFTQFDHRVKWQGQACRVWLRSVTVPSGTKEKQLEFVRGLLDETEYEARVAEADFLAAGAIAGAMDLV